MRAALLSLVFWLTVSGFFANHALASEDLDPESLAMANRVVELLTQKCHNCHGVDYMHENLNILDFELLREEPSPPYERLPYVVAGDLEGSLLWKVIEEDRMPPKNPLTSAEKKVIRDWIEGGAPEILVTEREFVADLQVLRAISSHLFGIRREDRKFQRYFSVHHIHNNRHKSDRDLTIYRAALAKAVNSMSRQASITVPKPIDDQQTVFAIDLRDYGWQSNDVWQAVLRDYPYGLKPQSSIEALELYEKIEELYGSIDFDGVTHIRGDWFVATATRPPLYHILTDTPQTMDELLERMNINISENFRLGTARRGGLFESGVSAQNRLVEYHSSSNGTFWHSYDFSENSGRGNLARFPLGPDFEGHPFPAFTFKHDGGEIIYNLPNGLHGYMLVNEEGKRIDAGPVEIVWDPLQVSGSPLIVNGVSCMSCHKHGMIDFQDFVREGNALQDPQARRKVRELYPEQSELQQALASTREAYMQKLRQTIGALIEGSDRPIGSLENIEEPVSRVAVLYRRNLDLETAARELGYQDIDSFRNNLSSGRLIELGMGPLQIENGIVKRSYWHSKEASVTVFQQVASELRIGSPYSN